MGLAAAALMLVAACSSGGKAAGTNGSAAPQTPRQALLTAAIQAQRINSAVETLSVRTEGASAGTLSGTVKAQLRPTLRVGENLHITAAGTNGTLKAIVTSKAIYFSEPELNSQVGKPWIKLNLSSLKGTGASFAQLLNSIQNNNFTSQTQLLTVSKDVRVVGHPTVDGVPTTEYAGSLKASAALKVLPASLRTSLAPALKAMGDSTIAFREWIDGQDHARKIAEVETVQGSVISTTINITAINQPVNITLPPASEVATAPNNLGSGSSGNGVTA